MNVVAEMRVIVQGKRGSNVDRRHEHLIDTAVLGSRTRQIAIQSRRRNRDDNLLMLGMLGKCRGNRNLSWLEIRWQHVFVHSRQIANLQKIA